MLHRPAAPPLRPFVASLWASEDHDPPPRSLRELVVPTGDMHLAIRLDAPLRLFADARDDRGEILGHTVVGGARAVAHHRCLGTPSRSVGAQLRPGAALFLFAASAAALAGQHTALDALWGRAATRLHTRLLEAPSAALRLRILEQELSTRLTRARRLHPLVAEALTRLHADPNLAIAPLAEHAGYSQRHLLELFREAVGLSPKRYARVLRLQRALPRLAAGERAIEVALAGGYADEAHLHRELRDVTGLSVREYHIAATGAPNHVAR